MAALKNPATDIASPAAAPDAGTATATHLALSKLSALHVEAVETAELANLLGRSLHVAIAVPAMAVAAFVLAGGAGESSTIAWAILIAVASLSIARAYGGAIRQPFERAVLHAFSKDIGACLLYAGFAWGAGAFLAIAPGASAGTALLFAAAPAAVIAALLRERDSVLLFLAPVAGLTSFACVLRPFAGGALDAALVLIASAIVAAAIVFASRYFAVREKVALPHSLIAH